MTDTFEYSVPANKIDYRRFSKEDFIGVVADLSDHSYCRNFGAAGSAGSAINQVIYLADYLQNTLKTHSILIEHHYIDRHYIEEVSYYYSRCLKNYPNYCARIHCFSSAIDDSVLTRLIQMAAKGDYKNAREQLQKAYQGYIVIRPIPSVPVGRTVLLPPPDGDSRIFPASVNYSVHLLGFDLSIKSVAFQQQDRAVAACATTSIWVALQGLCKADGSRTPTTYQITEAAVRKNTSSGRVFPSPGLIVSQMCDALRLHGYDPECFDVGNNPDMFRLLLNIYLVSGIPVILVLNTPNNAGHAVTVTGLEIDSTTAPLLKCSVEDDCRSGAEYSYVSNNLSFSKIYIHDDRTGPFVSTGIEEHVKKQEKFLYLNIDGEKLQIRLAIAPLYPKIRTNARELLSSLNKILPAVKGALVSEGKDEDFSLELKFVKSGDYCRSLISQTGSKDLLEFLKTAALSRYIGVAALSYNKKHLFDAVYDTTDTIRGDSWAENMVGMVAFNQKYRETVKGFSSYFKVPFGG